MKKTAIISTVLFLLIICNLQSCREHDMDQVLEAPVQVEKIKNVNLNLKINRDSTGHNLPPNVTNNENQLVDPPLRDRDQW